MLARTDAQAKKQEGISFFLVDMKTPGITVQPIQTIDGGHEVNEVFLDDVRVPADKIVGEENKGWDYAKFLLANERNGIARVGVSKARLDRVRELASIAVYGARPKIDDPFFRIKLAAVEVELKALEMTQMRVISNRRTRRQADPAVLGAQDQGLGVAAGDDRTADGRRRPLRPALSGARRHEQRAPRRAGLGGDHSRRPISTRARSRSTADRTRSSAASSPKRSWGSEQMDFDLSDEQKQLRDNVARLMKDKYGFESRKGYQASPQGCSEDLWRDYADWACSARPSPKTTAASAAARSRR